jgi:hypothetical protein
MRQAQSRIRCLPSLRQWLLSTLRSYRLAESDKVARAFKLEREEREMMKAIRRTRQTRARETNEGNASRAGETTRADRHVSFGEAFRFWVKLGFISFGGPPVKSPSCTANS